MLAFASSTSSYTCDDFMPIYPCSDQMLFGSSKESFECLDDSGYDDEADMISEIAEKIGHRLCQLCDEFEAEFFSTSDDIVAETTSCWFERLVSWIF
ncbi:unnamed protein product [Caenorhabditis bovis]|uniref:Uncharacterized protein n=1 Tax=Caenorhabditis bovis TaxID=2654633 RepID=A0A8S1EH43_9PELO|nr:unnamed protein product [Caenorhabditis bovis]